MRSHHRTVRARRSWSALGSGPVISAIIIGTLWAPPASADLVGDWNGAAMAAIRADRVPPPRATRVLAMMHVAAFDAMNAVRGRFQSYVDVRDVSTRGVSRTGAFASAAHAVLAAEFPAHAASFDAVLARSLARVSRGRQPASLALGVQVALRCRAVRAQDGSAASVPYVPSTLPGEWRPTPPGFAAALLPNWPRVVPWVLERGDELRSPSPPPLDSAEYAAAFAEVASLGRVDSDLRTAEETEIARFWEDGPGSQTPPGHWNDVALLVSQGSTLIQRARLMAILNLALADAAIVSWDTKYHYDHWRPVTAIHEAGTDGNDATSADAAWSSLIVTPPFPAYTSGHSTFSGAASAVLATVLGRDDIPVTIGSDGLPGVLRTFGSLSEAAEESGWSRILGGIHWSYDNREGLAAGRALGTRVATSQYQRR